MKKIMLTLGLKIGFFFLMVALIPLLIASLLQSIEGEKNFKQQAFDQLEGESGDITFTLYQFFLERFSDIQLLSKNSIIKDVNASIAEKRGELLHVHDINQFYDDITLIDTKGKVITSTTFSSRDLSRTEWYAEAITGKIVISEPIIILSPKKIVMNFFHPVFDDDDQVTSIVVTQLNMQHVHDLIDTIEIEEGSFVFVTDQYGNIIDHPVDELLFQKIDNVYPGLSTGGKSTGTMIYDNGDESFLVGFSTLKRVLISTGEQTTWTVFVNRNERDSLSLLVTFREQIFKILIGVFILVVILVVVLSRQIVDPIKKLRNVTREITQGNLDAAIDIYSTDEIGELAQSFDIMKHEIKKSRTNLENKVKERTMQLEEEKKSVEKKVVARTKNLKLANEKIHELLRQKDIFIGQVAHDLRTPLTPVVGSLQLLQYKISDRKNKKIINEALRNAAYLMKLLNSTLAMAVLDSNKRNLNLEQVNMSDFLGKIIEDQSVVFSKKGIRVIRQIKKTPDIFVDKTKIEEVVNNIISNAYKFLADKPSLTFSVEALPKAIKVRVKDNGIGMKKETLSKIFVEFYKEDKSRHHLSTGLGLSICRRIISRHGGKIWAESEGLGKGSSFIFLLPIKNKK